jgi:hypothetical protein
VKRRKTSDGDQQKNRSMVTGAASAGHHPVPLGKKKDFFNIASKHYANDKVFDVNFV